MLYSAPLSLAKLSWALAALCCISLGACAGEDPFPFDGGGAVTNDGGLRSEIVMPCNDLVNTAPTTYPTCEGMCPGCPGPGSGTSPIRDGMYVMKQLVMYTEECDLQTGSSIRGRLQVAGSIMNLVIEQPGTSVGDIVTLRTQYEFQLSNGQLNMRWTCPAGTSAALTQGVNYASDGRAFRFSILPGILGETVFVPE
jgi:hypothetical protein